MRYNQFIKENNLNEDVMLDVIVPEKMFMTDLSVNGWSNVDAKHLYDFHKDFNELNIICTNPNFYYDGRCIVEGRSFKILASGEMRVKYADKEYLDMFSLFQDWGTNVLQDWNKLEWLETKGWIVVSRKHGGFYGEFDLWDDCPKHKEVKL